MSNRHRRSRRSGDPAPDATNQRALLARLTGSPDLVRAVRRLSPEMLHGVIRTCGLEDSAELLALTTREQLTAVLDLDLWRTDHPGHEEHLDAGRFCEWLEALAETGAHRAAETIAKMDPALVIAALASEIAVFDLASGVVAEGVDREFGGYRVVARRTGSWDTIVTVLIALEDTAPDVFHRVMRGCRRLSNSAPEIDGLDDLLGASDQGMFELAIGRETRRDAQGYVTPAEARAFLTSSRELHLDRSSPPPSSPLLAACLREIALSPEVEEQNGAPASGESHETPDAAASNEESVVASLIEALLDAGGGASQPRALLAAADEEPTRFPLVTQQMQLLREHDPSSHARRGQELAFLANVLMAGCPLQGRAFTREEAADAVAAVCNLGLENWPSQWRAPWHSDVVLASHDLAVVFQVGIAVLHRDVSMRVAQHVIDTLALLRCSDGDIQRGLHVLRGQLTKHTRAGMPWQARNALDVLAMLDQPAWVALLGLLSEFPVMLANVSAAGSGRPPLSIDPARFELIADNAGIACVQRFLEMLPDALTR